MVSAADDKVAPPEAGRRLAELLGTHHEVVPGAMPVSCRQPVTPLLLDFLRDPVAFVRLVRQALRSRHCPAVRGLACSRFAHGDCGHRHCTEENVMYYRITRVKHAPENRRHGGDAPVQGSADRLLEGLRYVRIALSDTETGHLRESEEALNVVQHRFREVMVDMVPLMAGPP